MNTSFRASLTVRLCSATVVAALFLIPSVCQAQVNNTKAGNLALSHVTAGGNYNAAFGYAALYFDTSGYNNTANGAWSLFSNTTGSWNTPAGLNALFYN